MLQYTDITFISDYRDIYVAINKIMCEYNVYRLVLLIIRTKDRWRNYTKYGRNQEIRAGIGAGRGFLL